MKQFIFRLTIISLIVLAMSLILHRVVYPRWDPVPWTYGSVLLEQKRQQLVNADPGFNGIVIGSSRMYRQVNPAVLDSVLNNSGAFRTYNMGVNWLFVPESFYVYDRLINSDKLRFRYVVIELSKIRSIDYANLHTARIKYWYTDENFIFSVRAVAASGFSVVEKTATLLAHTISYFGNLINLGYLTEVFSFKTESRLMREKGTNSAPNGFLPLRLEEAQTGEENTAIRNRNFLADTSVVTRRMEVSRDQFAKFEQQPHLLNTFNNVYAGMLSRMIAEAKERDVHLVFLLSPRIDKNQYNELIPLFHQIPAAHRVELSDSRKYPELYLARYSFDETHLNEEGARHYSRLLGEKLKSLPGLAE